MFLSTHNGWVNFEWNFNQQIKLWFQEKRICYLQNVGHFVLFEHSSVLRMFLPSASQNHNTSDTPLPPPPCPLPQTPTPQPPQCHYTCCFWYEKYCPSLTYYWLVSVRIFYKTWFLKMYLMQGWGEYYMGTLPAHGDTHVLKFYSSTDFPVLIFICSVRSPTLIWFF